MTGPIQLPLNAPRFWIAGPAADLIDTAATGLAGAIVTNPDVLAAWHEADRVSPEITAMKLADLTGLPVFLQLRGPSRDDFLRQADAVRRLHPMFLPKLPATRDGFAATAALRGTPVLVTAVATISQAAAASAAGAGFICPYFARLRDEGLDPGKLCSDAATLYQRTGSRTEVVPASLRTTGDFEAALHSGATGGIVFTSLFRELLEHPGVARALEGFERSWAKCPDHPMMS